MVRTLVVSFCFAVLTVGGVAAAPFEAQRSPIATDELGQGRHARMQALLEKTLFNVDVVHLDIRFDEATARELARWVQRGSYSEGVERAIADTAVHAENAAVVLRFERDISLDRFVEGGRKNMRRAYEAGMISRENYPRVHAGLPRWFGFLEDRGFVEGDELHYRVRPDSLRTVLVDRSGRKLLDQTDEGEKPRLALLSGYFAPGSDFREPLIRSLFAR